MEGGGEGVAGVIVEGGGEVLEVSEEEWGWVGRDDFGEGYLGLRGGGEWDAIWCRVAAESRPKFSYTADAAASLGVVHRPPQLQIFPLIRLSRFSTPVLMKHPFSHEQSKVISNTA